MDFIVLSPVAATTADGGGPFILDQFGVREGRQSRLDKRGPAQGLRGCRLVGLGPVRLLPLWSTSPAPTPVDTPYRAVLDRLAALA